MDAFGICDNLHFKIIGKLFARNFRFINTTVPKKGAEEVSEENRGITGRAMR